MGYPFGLAPDAGGNGTTPAGLQRIIAAEYGATGGRIRGCAVSRKSTMAYDVAAGAVVVMTGTDLAVVVPVDPVTVTTPAAPASGSRRDYVVVSSAGLVSVVQAPPASGTVIAEFVVPAGITGTTGASQVTDSRFAMPTGVPLGPLVPRWTDPASTGTAANAVLFTLYQQTMPLVPTDRWVELTITQALACGAGQRGSMRYIPTVTNMTGIPPASAELSYSEYYEPKQFTWGFWLLAGPNPSVITIQRQKAAGVDAFHFNYGTIDVLDRGGAH